MITREELLRSKEFWLVQFQAKLYEQVECYLIENNLSKTAFAQELGVSKGYISQLLNGNFDHKISKLIELSLAIGKVPVLTFENIDQHIKKDKRSTQPSNSGTKNILKQKSPQRRTIKAFSTNEKLPSAQENSPIYKKRSPKR